MSTGFVIIDIVFLTEVSLYTSVYLYLIDYIFT